MIYALTSRTVTIYHLNLLIKRDELNADGAKLSADKISVYEINSGTSIDLKMDGVNEHKIVNAVSMSEPLSDIYSEYNRLK